MEPLPIESKNYAQPWSRGGGWRVNSGPVETSLTLEQLSRATLVPGKGELDFYSLTGSQVLFAMRDYERFARMWLERVSPPELATCSENLLNDHGALFLQGDFAVVHPVSDVIEIALNIRTALVGNSTVNESDPPAAERDYREFLEALNAAESARAIWNSDVRTATSLSSDHLRAALNPDVVEIDKLSREVSDIVEGLVNDGLIKYNVILLIEHDRDVGFMPMAYPSNLAGALWWTVAGHSMNGQVIRICKWDR